MKRKNQGLSTAWGAAIYGAALLVVLAVLPKPALAQVKSVPASQVMLWSITPGVGLGALDVAPTAGKLVFTADPSAADFVLIDPATGQYQVTPPTGKGDVRKVVWVSPELGQDILIGGYQSFWVLRLDGSVLWDALYGCCNIGHLPVALDFSRHAVTLLTPSLAEFDLGTGSLLNQTGGSTPGYVSVASPGNFYLASTWDSAVASFNPGTGSTNFGLVGISGSGTAGRTRPVAVAADGSAVVARGEDHFDWSVAVDPGSLAHVTTNGTVLWNLAVNAVTPPVIGANGTIYIGTQAPSASNGAIEAHDPTSGALLWTQPVNGTPNDLLVADNGQIYAVAGDPYMFSSGELDGFDQATGAPTLNVTGVAGVCELILQNGVIYTSGFSVTAIPVPANGYDTQSPWPVRFHDNQRTGNAAAPLNLGKFPGSDRTPPTISISSPGPNVYLLNQQVTASYSCTDDTSVASCTGSIPSGSPIDTSSVGTKTLTVTAVDSAGLTSTQSVTYTVAYNNCALYNQSASVKSGATLPVKLELCDANSVDESTSAIVVHAASVTQTSTDASETVQDSGNSNPDFDFRFDSTLGTAGGYIFNLQTTGYPTGTYSLQFTAAGDPTSHSVMFQVR